jgi:hypothetical protein
MEATTVPWPVTAVVLIVHVILSEVVGVPQVIPVAVLPVVTISPAVKLELPTADENTTRKLMACELTGSVCAGA